MNYFKTTAKLFHSMFVKIVIFILTREVCSNQAKILYSFLPYSSGNSFCSRNNNRDRSLILEQFGHLKKNTNHPHYIPSKFKRQRFHVKFIIHRDVHNYVYNSLPFISSSLLSGVQVTDFYCFAPSNLHFNSPFPLLFLPCSSRFWSGYFVG